MADTERVMIQTFIGSRLEIAYQRLSNNPAYLKHCRAQEESEFVVDKLLQAFSKDDRISLWYVLPATITPRFTNKICAKALTYWSV